MTEERFFEILAESKGEWKLRGTGNNIRKPYPNAKSILDAYCPLTFVAFMSTGESFHLGQYDEARAALNFTKLLSRTIMRSADGHGDATMRARLLAAVGLEGGGDAK